MAEEFTVTNRLSVGESTKNIEITKDRIIINQLSALEVERSNNGFLLEPIPKLSSYK